MQIQKRDGSLEKCDKSKIRRCVERACKGLDEVSVDEIVEEAYLQLYEGMNTGEIDKATILAARSRILGEPEYSYAAAGLLLNVLYKEVFNHGVDQRVFNTDYRGAFIANLEQLIVEGYLNPELTTKFDLARLASILKPDRDRNFKYLGLQTLYDRYFQKIGNRRLETPQAFWMRVAMGICLNEPNPTEAAVEAYELFSKFLYCPGTPTLFNSGTTHPQLSSCYLSTVDDSIDGIFGSIHGQARLSKYAGGLGSDWTPIRSLNSWIHGTNGPSQGLIPWLKIYNDMLVAVNQGSKRKGAGCAYLETWHGDILDFLDLRKNTGDDRRRCHDMNTAHWIPDLFMKQVRCDGEWYIFSPAEVPDLHDSVGKEFEEKYWQYVEQGRQGKLKTFSEVKAKDLWKKMLTAIFETGHPWITWKDPSNIRYSNKHAGVVHSSNLCTEILLHSIPTLYKDAIVTKYGETAVCNLGSINLAAHMLDEFSIDWGTLANTVKKAVRLLDNVIDINFYPTPEARQSNLMNRPVGLGQMGWADVLHVKRIPYDSEEASNLAGQIQEFISYYAITASAELAKERQTYPTYHASTWSNGVFPIDTYKTLMEEHRGVQVDITNEETINWDVVRALVAKYGVRNSNVMAIAPTATISYIVGCSQSTEPDFGVLFVYSTLSGEFTMLNEHFVQRMKEIGRWNEKLIREIQLSDGDVSRLNLPDDIKNEYKTAFGVGYKAIIDAAAQRQKWIDMGQSTNLYSDKTSLKYLSDMYFYAWDNGLKTTYYLRTKSASSVEKSTVSLKEPESACSIEAAKNGEICEACQ